MLSMDAALELAEASIPQAGYQEPLKSRRDFRAK
jgi:hypothetical protein